MTMFLARNVIRLLESGKGVHPAAIEARNALLLESTSASAV